MLKFGIYKPEQLSRSNLESFFAKKKFIAADLYDQIPASEDADADFIQERILSRLPMANGTFKYTFFQRFESFDDACIQAIRENFSSKNRIYIHDAGVSDGRTAAALYLRLEKVFESRNLDFTASDLFSNFKVIQRGKSGWRVIADERNNIVQIVTPPFVFNMAHPESGALYPVNFVIRHLLTRFYALPALRKEGAPSKSLLFICRPCRELMEVGKIRFQKHDIMEPMTRRCDVIRVMNLLNAAYFSEESLSTALRNIADALNEGGLFIAGSNAGVGCPVNGAIYRKEKDLLARIAISGKGFLPERLIKSGTH